MPLTIAAKSASTSSLAAVAFLFLLLLLPLHLFELIRGDFVHEDLISSSSNPLLPPFFKNDSCASSKNRLITPFYNDIISGSAMCYEAGTYMSDVRQCSHDGVQYPERPCTVDLLLRLAEDKSRSMLQLITENAEAICDNYFIVSSTVSPPLFPPPDAASSCCASALWEVTTALLSRQYERSRSLSFAAKLTSTTTPRTLSAFKSYLTSLAPSDESKTLGMRATGAVKQFESQVGWNSITSDFNNPDHPALSQLRQESLSSSPSLPSSPLLLSDDEISARLASLLDRPLEDLIDIVVPTIRNVSFLDHWKPFIEKCNVIILQDGDPDVDIFIPSWVKFELYNRRDIAKLLGDDAWMISQRDASIRSFGFLVSDKKFVYTLDDNSLPATTSDGRVVNAVAEHLYNLLTPSTPDFFNTVYDPFRAGADFVRGYPYSRRGGVPTAVSHGLWLSAYDYDAPTQLLKGMERNTRYVDATLTVPKGVLYPLSFTNVAFNKHLIGPALMQGLVGDGEDTWGRYDEMFAGWASKVIGDHLNVGAKSGAPYIFSNKMSNPFQNLEKDYVGLFWQEEVIAFFESVKLSPSSSYDAPSTYLNLADEVERGLSHINPYFTRLARAMRKWVELWIRRFGRHGSLCELEHKIDTNSEHLSERDDIYNFNMAFPTECVPTLVPVSSRSRIRPSSPSATCAVFTVVRDEKDFLPLWVRYYSRHFDVRDMYILDHFTTDGSTDPANLPSGINVIQIRGDSSHMPHFATNRQIEKHAQRFLRYGYQCYIFTDVDEILVPDPELHPQGLGKYVADFVADDSRNWVRSVGANIIHASWGTAAEAPIDWSKNIVEQREFLAYSGIYCKTLLSKVPLRFSVGFHIVTTHKEEDIFVPDRSLILVHLHSFDQGYCEWRERRKFDWATKIGKRDEHHLGMNAYIGGSWGKAFLTHCELALYFGKNHAKVEGGESELSAVWSRSFVKDDGSVEDIKLNPDHLGGSSCSSVIWGDGTWMEAFYAHCPSCTFEGREPAKVQGYPSVIIALDRKAGTERVCHLAEVSNHNGGEVILRMGRTWRAVVNI